jgi:hypothetical protein
MTTREPPAGRRDAPADVTEHADQAGNTWTSGDRADQNVGQLVVHASQQAVELVRQELRLALVEMKDKGRHAGLGVGLVGGAAIVALFGAGALLFAVIALLALILPVWGSALIVGGVLLIAAAVMAIIGRRQVSRAVPPVPDSTMKSTKQDVSDITERARR